MRLLANGLEHHVHTWGDRSGSPIVLLHGFMDAGGTWDLVAPMLAEKNRFVLAPDLRGFGKTARVPKGGYYHFPDYIADLAQMARVLELESFDLVGHSMGGTIASLFSGARPTLVRKLAIIEGVGPPDNTPDLAPDRMSRWLSDLEKPPKDRAMPSMDDVVARLQSNHPLVSHEVLRTRAKHLVREEDGSFWWSFDPMHRTTSPVPFFSSIYKAFAARVTCPVLFVSGGAKGWHPPDEDERVAAFKDVTRIEIADAGHMVHWTKPNDLASALLSFF